MGFEPGTTGWQENSMTTRLPLQSWKICEDIDYFHFIIPKNDVREDVSYQEMINL